MAVVSAASRPEISITDQGSQFTSFAFATVLEDAGVHISMGVVAGWTTSFNERL